MPPTGSWSATPSMGFSFPRPHITWFEWFVNMDNSNITFDGEVFTIGSFGFPNIIQYVKIKDGWWEWDSRGFRLGELVTNYWYVVLPSPVEIPNAGLQLNLFWDYTKRGWGIQFQKESPDTHIDFDWEHSPPSYWMHPLPGES